MEDIDTVRALALLCREEGIRSASIGEIRVEMAFVRNPDQVAAEKKVAEERKRSGLEEEKGSSRGADDWLDAMGNAVPVIHRGGKIHGQ